MTSTFLLSQLPDGARGVVARVVSAGAELDAVALRRLGEIGFIPGEPVQLMRRGPGGREPLAVVVGETMFALRLLEAQCIEVVLDTPAGAAAVAAAPARAEAPARMPADEATQEAPVA